MAGDGERFRLAAAEPSCPDNLGDHFRLIRAWFNLADPFSRDRLCHPPGPCWIDRHSAFHHLLRTRGPITTPS